MHAMSSGKCEFEKADQMQSMPSNAVTKVARFLVAVFVLLVVPLPLWAQGSQGTIDGGVFDSTGGVLPGANVTITDVARGTVRNLVTDEQGKYSAPSLTTGTYMVRAEIAGFSTTER